MNKKRNIFKIILFLLGLLILLVILSKVFIPKNNTVEAGIHNVTANGILGEKSNTIDIIILGDSESFTAISPMKIWKDYGFTVYNGGVSSQYLYDTYSYLKKSLNNQSPKIVVLETNAIFRKIPLSNVLGAYGKRILPIFKYHNRWKTMTSKDFKDKVKYTWTDDLKGFSINKTTKSVPLLKDYMSYTEEREQIKLLNMYYLNKIVNECKKNNIEVVLLSTPSTVNWNYKRHNVVADYAKNNGVTYLDLNLVNDLNIDWQNDTRDAGDHLNYYGAMKVTDYMGSYFARMHILDDHREDEKYKNWNVAYEKYIINEKLKNNVNY